MADPREVTGEVVSDTSIKSDKSDQLKLDLNVAVAGALQEDIRETKTSKSFAWEVLIKDIDSNHLLIITQKYKELLDQGKNGMSLQLLKLFCEHSDCTLEEKMDFLVASEGIFQEITGNEGGFDQVTKETFQVYFFKHITDRNEVGSGRTADGNQKIDFASIKDQYARMMNHPMMQGFTPSMSLLTTCRNYCFMILHEKSVFTTTYEKRRTEMFSRFNELFNMQSQESNDSIGLGLGQPFAYQDFLSIFSALK